MGLDFRKELLPMSRTNLGMTTTKTLYRISDAGRKRLAKEVEGNS